MDNARSHPTPWTIDVFAPSRATAIYDAQGVLVETVYERGDDVNGQELAQRIVNAVNQYNQES